MFLGVMPRVVAGQVVGLRAGLWCQKCPRRPVSVLRARMDRFSRLSLKTRTVSHGAGCGYGIFARDRVFYVSQSAVAACQISRLLRCQFEFISHPVS